MTNQELEQIYKATADVSHGDALRVIYNLGHMTGAGVDPAIAPKDVAATLAKPLDRQIVGTKTASTKR